MSIDYYMSETIGIYKIQNKIDQKVYIGSSVNLDNRRAKHFWMLNKGIHDNEHLQNSFNKNGDTNFIFEVLENCEKETLIERENFYIEKFNSNDSSFGYNLAKVSDSRKNILNTEVKIKLSKHNLSKNNNFTKYSLSLIVSNFIESSLSLGSTFRYFCCSGICDKLMLRQLLRSSIPEKS